MIAALFDCDGTLFSAQFGRGLLQYCEENGQQRIARSYYLSLLIPYLLSKLNLISPEAFTRKVMAKLARLLKGWNVEESRTVFEWLVHDYLLSTQHTELISKLRDHQSKGHKVVLVSAQFLPTLELLGTHFNVDGVIGTMIEVKDHHYTGRIIPPVITGQDKSLQARQFFSERDIEINWGTSFAYADSITDLEMLNLVGNPTAVNPEEKLKKYGKGQQLGSHSNMMAFF